MADSVVLDDRTATTVAELEKDPRGVVKRWTMELHLADQAEEDWRKEVKETFETYEAEKASSYSDFNVLYSNTETLAPAVFNTAPEPDVRRRYRDEDPIGRYASEVMERALSYEIDTDDYDSTCEDMVLDVLISGRGVCRVKYVPTTAPLDPVPGQPAEEEHADPAEAGMEEIPQMTPEIIVDQEAPIDHVQWDDFRHGPAKRWDDVQWIGFRHEMTKDDLVANFGEQMAKLVPLTEKPADSSSSKEDEDKDKQVFKTAEVWEIWDKEQLRVLFICSKYKERPLKMVDDPMGLPGFFPMPRPVRAIHNSRSLVPIPPYRQYKKQAKQLSILTKRIARISDALKVKGAYNAVSEEIQKVMTAGDMAMIPITAQAETAQAGGLDKSIWLWPTDMYAKTLQDLYLAREQLIQSIYQISGVSDIIRGATDPDETATAQTLKSKWGSLRLDKLKRDVARFIRDMMRLQADVIATKFEIDILEQITQVQLPRQQEKEMLMQQAQQMQQQIQMATQQVQQMQQQGPTMVSPEMMMQAPALMQQIPQLEMQLQQLQADPKLALPSWEDIMAVLQNDLQRAYRIDIETDSTVAETVETDMEELRNTMETVAGFIAQATPAVQAGALPMEALKDMCLSYVRHAKLGRQFEDAIEQLQAPAPPPPEAPPAPEGPTTAELKASLDELKQMIGEITVQTKTPKSLKAQASPDGTIQGSVGEAA